VERMAAGRPYADVEALLGESDRAVQALGRDDLAEALAGHPRIGNDPDTGWGAVAGELRQTTRRRLEGLLRP
jgi:2-oxo-4-hydroxy-4-carboxy-5-ureidoimidazoline decarboxylase